MEKDCIKNVIKISVKTSRSFSLNLNFINLDMGNILSASACSFAIPFLEKMAVHAAVPIMLLVTLLLARIPAYILHKKHRTKQRALFIKLHPKNYCSSQRSEKDF